MYEQKYLEGLGVQPEDLTTGRLVMVPVGRIPAAVNGHPPVIAMARVLGPADDPACMPGAAGDVWWLDVFTGGGTRLPQMYRTGEVLGLPAYGMTMPGVEQ